jgi:hypothetical protein
MDGMDCVGVILEFYRRAFGIVIPDPLSDDTDVLLNAPFAAQFERVAAPLPGDIVRIGARHLAVALGRYALHADRLRGTVMVRYELFPALEFYRSRALMAEP